MNSISDLYKTVHTAWREGRLENVLQRQKELAALHATIKRLTSRLVKSLQSDLQTTEESAVAEIKSALDAVKFFYDTLDFPGSLKKEKSIKAGANVDKCLVPLGPSLIDPNPHAPVSSTIIPLAAAIAAGSAIVVVTINAVPMTSELLRTVIEDSLDREAVKATQDDSAETRQQLGLKYFEVAVLQSIEHRSDFQKMLHENNSFIRVLTPSSGLPAAFVDRSASNLEAVASHIHCSVLQSPRHQPLRVPRLFLVDEIIIDALVNLLYHSIGKDNNLSKTTNREETQALRDLLINTFPSLEEALSQHSFTQLPPIISLKSTDPIIAESIQMVAEMMTARNEGVLLVPTRSLDHGIDILDKLNRNKISQATYIFGEGTASFYVGAFSQSLNVFVNQIPSRSLVTIVPFSPTSSYELPYSQEDFSINKSTTQGRVGASAQPQNSFWPIVSHKLRLWKIQQPKGGRLSYFERGLIVGLTVTIIAISGISVTINRGVRFYLKSL